MASKRPRGIVLGIGNPDRGGRCGRASRCPLLRGVLPVDIEIAEHDAEATGLLSRLGDFPEAFLVDACASGAPCGTVQRFDVSTAPLPRGVSGLSTHGFGLAEVIELGRALGKLPPRCIVNAIEGCAFRNRRTNVPARGGGGRGCLGPAPCRDPG